MGNELGILGLLLLPSFSWLLLIHLPRVYLPRPDPIALLLDQLSVIVEPLLIVPRRALLLDFEIAALFVLVDAAQRRVV